MVRVRDVPKEEWEKIFPTWHYQAKRKRIKDTSFVILGHTAPGVKEFIELYAEYLFFRGVLNALAEYKVKEDADTIWLKDVYLPDIKRTLDLCWITVYKKKRGDPFIENEKQQVMFDYLKNIAYNRALTFYEMYQEKYGHLVKECDSCKQMFVATRADSKYCDRCRNKVHIYNYREAHKKPLAPIKCEYDGCKKKFTPKTTRARFCSDICRVRNNRFERAEIKERNELCKQIRAEEERTGIYAITLDEVIHLLEIAPSKKYLQSIKYKK